MHPLFMDRLATERQCDLYEVAGAACGPASLAAVGRRTRRGWRLGRRKDTRRYC